MAKTSLALLAAFGLALPSAALANPPEAPFEGNDAVWLCDDDGFIPGHCLNTRSRGRTGVIMVFDGRGPAEGISHDPRVDSRPCPSDADSPDGTWWEVLTGTWVCHHKPN